MGRETSRNRGEGACFPGFGATKVCRGGWRGMVLGEWAEDWELPIKQKEGCTEGKLWGWGS